MKLHIGMDDSFGLIHSLTTMATNEHDIVVTDRLLHGEEEQVWSHAGYQGIEERDEHEDREVEWNIFVRPGKRKQMRSSNPEARVEKTKAQALLSVL